MFWIFWEMTSGNIYVFSTLWFDSGYMSASVYEASGRIYTRFLRVWVDSAPEDDSRLALWTSPFLRSWSRLWKFLSLRALTFHT